MKIFFNLIYCLNRMASLMLKPVLLILIIELIALLLSIRI